MAASTWVLAGEDRATEIKPNDGLRHARGELVAPGEAPRGQGATTVNTGSI